jgi:threonine/homoserine/homoserine lactone efflux protein
VNSIGAFALFAGLLAVTPGLDTMLVLRTAARDGRRVGLAAAAGVGLGCLVWAVCGALGVTAVLAASRLAFDGLRAAGVAYLCWLGARALWHARRTPVVPATVAQESTVDSNRAVRALRTGFTTNMLNPKVGVFYLSVMPQFLPAGLSTFTGSMLLGAIHIGEGAVWSTLVVLAVHRVRGWLTRPAVGRWLEGLTGVVFLGFGLRLALEKAPH